MRATSTEAALGFSRHRGWDFGDYPYSMEPLTLPHPPEPVTLAPGSLSPAAEDAVTRFLAEAREGFGTTDPVDAESLERLFWFRWIIGHHVSFVIWRLIADALADVHEGTGDQDAAAVRLTEYVRAYCGMLLYTGSSTREIYQRTIRPSMYRQHDKFSGTWAPDYPAVRSLFRGRRPPPVVPHRTAELLREIALTNQIHLGVASKLVERGRSLLQAAVLEGNIAAHRSWGAVFDCYFLTLRAPVDREEVTAQLLRRQKAVAIDLATNGLYPDVGDALDPVPEELREPAVAECEKDLIPALVRTAALAAGRAPDTVTGSGGGPYPGTGTDGDTGSGAPAAR
ncbi:hypothetical protein ABZ714_26895 [Streptomyces sp. NPDC006798]|uniref:hypothetical protein n=1 Tax=Streptomyces sp. NPDC006798 TaxID=3155462 RepID=UPI003401F9DE